MGRGIYQGKHKIQRGAIKYHKILEYLNTVFK